MQGWSPDFISRLTESAVDEGLVDEIVPVAGDKSMRLAKDLARKEGIFVGTSAGATLAAALEVAGRAQAGANIVCMLPDTAERYLSTPLFEDVGVEMDDEELALSRSTPSCRFDAPAPPAPAQESKPAPALDPAADKFVSEVIRENRVVVFALEWCEFCWSARKLFARLGVEYESVDLDSVAFQEGDRGGLIRAVLKERIGSPTIPQIYINGEHIGGCTELMDEMRSGRLRQRLEACGVEIDAATDFDPYDLLPQWLHSRKSA
jgi:cysteine synthase A